MVKANDRPAFAGFDLSTAVFLGASVGARAKGAVAEEGPGRTIAPLTPRVGRADHCRCVARPVPGAVAQGDLGATEARGLKWISIETDDPPGFGSVAGVRVAERDVHSGGWLVADRLGTGSGRSRLGCGGKEIF